MGQALSLVEVSSKVGRNYKANLLDFAEMISHSADLMDKGVYYHGQQVACIALQLFQAAGISGNENTLRLAAYLHDIGIPSSELKEKSKEFLLDDELIQQHCIEGSDLLDKVDCMRYLAPIVRHHHIMYKNFDRDSHTIPMEARIIHLSDRISILIDRRSYILDQVENIREMIKKYTGTMFDPEWVEVFNELSQKEAFWLNIENNNRYSTARAQASREKTEVNINMKDIEDIARLCGRTVDRKSPYTALHSAHVASIAQGMGRHLGMVNEDISYLGLAGQLHDLGKIAVPEEILHKPGKLTDQEFRCIRQHTYHTYDLIDRLNFMDKVRDWAAFHHERVDGQGYPFRIQGQKLDLGSRIMAVADKAAALVENRSYRPAFNPAEVMSILWDQVKDGAIDGDVVKALYENFDEIV